MPCISAEIKIFMRHAPKRLDSVTRRYNSDLFPFEGVMSDNLFPLSHEHIMIRDDTRDFAQKEIAPIAAQFDESGEFPLATIKKMGALGLMGIEVPEQYGGAGLDTLSDVLALEEVCKVDASHGVVSSLNNSIYFHDIFK